MGVDKKLQWRKKSLSRAGKSFNRCVKKLQPLKEEASMPWGKASNSRNSYNRREKSFKGHGKKLQPARHADDGASGDIESCGRRHGGAASACYDDGG